MPIYEYACKKCGKTIEVIQKFSDPVLRKHKECGGALTKLISASGFQFKGTGWYVTDYAKKTGGPASETKDAAPKGDSSPTSTGESSTPAPAKTKTESSKKSSDSKN
jgi:putative FmdB family regulatory protein